MKKQSLSKQQLLLRFHKSKLAQYIKNTIGKNILFFVDSQETIDYLYKQFGSCIPKKQIHQMFIRIVDKHIDKERLKTRKKDKNKRKEFFFKSKNKQKFDYFKMKKDIEKYLVPSGSCEPNGSKIIFADDNKDEAFDSNEMYQYQPIVSNLFYTDDCVRVDGTDSIDAKSARNTRLSGGYVDIYFLSSVNNRVVYNVTISTAYNSAFSEWNSIVHAKRKISEVTEKDIESQFIESIFSRFSFRKNKFKLNMFDYYLEKSKKDINQDNLCGFVKFEQDYYFGIGLQVELANTKYLTVDVIEYFIRKFWEIEAINGFDDENNIKYLVGTYKDINKNADVIISEIKDIIAKQEEINNKKRKLYDEFAVHDWHHFYTISRFIIQNIYKEAKTKSEYNKLFGILNYFDFTRAAGNTSWLFYTILDDKDIIENKKVSNIELVNWLKQLFSKFYKFYNFDVFIRETESWKQIKHLAQQEKDNQLKQQIVLTLEELYSKSSEIALMFLEYVLWHNSNVDIDEVRTILSNVDVDEINSNDVVIKHVEKLKNNAIRFFNQYDTVLTPEEYDEKVKLLDSEFMKLNS